MADQKAAAQKVKDAIRALNTAIDEAYAANLVIRLEVDHTSSFGATNKPQVDAEIRADFS